MRRQLNGGSSRSQKSHSATHVAYHAPRICSVATTIPVAAVVLGASRYTWSSGKSRHILPSYAAYRCTRPLSRGGSTAVVCPWLRNRRGEKRNALPVDACPASVEVEHLIRAPLLPSTYRGLCHCAMRYVFKTHQSILMGWQRALQWGGVRKVRAPSVFDRQCSGSREDHTRASTRMGSPRTVSEMLIHAAKHDPLVVVV
jgi:hypothetical protein